jgi:hypothetical protein
VGERIARFSVYVRSVLFSYTIGIIYDEFSHAINIVF